MRFSKMHGTGNDYVYINAFEESLPDDLPALARTVADRHFGIGGDGMILICPSERADVRMRMFNADGSEAEMCGNGIRCVAKYVYDYGLVRREELRIETGNGVLTLQLFPQDGRVAEVRVNMGRPIFPSREIPTTLPGDPPVRAPLKLPDRTIEVTCLSMGNPHCITFVDEPTDDWVHRIGPQIERHPAFPNRVNAEFVQIHDPTEINMRVWERGSGETMACGTGACAALVAGVLNELTERTVRCHVPGGMLTLEWANSGEVYLTGPAKEVFRGEWPIDW